MLTNPKGMDELFWNKEFEDVLNWTKRLEMASKVQGYDEIKLFKIIRLNYEVKHKIGIKSFNLHLLTRMR